MADKNGSLLSKDAKFFWFKPKTIIMIGQLQRVAFLEQGRIVGQSKLVEVLIEREHEIKKEQYESSYPKMFRE